MSSLHELIRLSATFSIADPLSPSPSVAAKLDGSYHFLSPSSSGCHGFFRDAALVVPSALFVLYLAFHAKTNHRKLTQDRSYIIVAHYALLWFSALLNLAWCLLQRWQCIHEKEGAWNLLSLFTTSGMLCLEISSLAFFLQDNLSSGVETLGHTSIISGLIVGGDVLLKAIFIFGFGVPLYLNGNSSWTKWSFWTVSKLLLTAVYGYILFVQHPKWREKLPSRPGFYQYIIVMFVVNALAIFTCGLAASGTGFGLGMYAFMDICYHSFYLPFLFITFLADFFQGEDLILDNAYYSEMRDAGFFDAGWD